MSECIRVSMTRTSVLCGESTTVMLDLIDSSVAEAEVYISYGTIGKLGIDYLIHTGKDSTVNKVKIINGKTSHFEIKNISSIASEYTILLEAINSDNISICEHIPYLKMSSCTQLLKDKAKLCFDPFPINETR